LGDEFPKLNIPSSQIAYEEIERRDVLVYFSAPIAIP
jgi:hypothetical protein